MKNIRLLIFFAIVSYACHDESDLSDTLRNQNGLAVFLAENTWDPSQPSAIPALQDLTLQPTPWIATEYIAFYDFSTHLIHLREGITIHENTLPERGIFVIVANGERR